MAGVNLNKIASVKDHRLVDGFLQAFPELHDGDNIVTPDEVSNLLDRNRDGGIDINDWKKIATPEYPISRRAFADVAKILGVDVAGTFHLVCDVPKADLHIHFGGNANIRFLYLQALDRVGTLALEPEKWGGRINWDSELLFTNYHDPGKKMTLDEAVRIAKKGFVSPSQVIEEGQEIKRKLSSEFDPEKRRELEKAQEENFRRFEKLATFTPSEGTSNLEDFLNIYQICGSLVEQSMSSIVRFAAIESAMRGLSIQGVRYAEIRIGLPKKSLVAIYPELAPEDALYKLLDDSMVNTVMAIKDANNRLIAEGLDPVDLRIVPTFSKSASFSDANLLQTKALVKFLEARPYLAHWIVGIDGAAKEVGELPDLYKEHFSLVKAYNEKTKEKFGLVGITWHQGEAFNDTSIFGSIRRIERLVEMGIRRLGHGLALGLEPKRFLGQAFTMSIDDYIDYLRYDLKSRFKYPVHIYMEGHKGKIIDEIARAESLKAKGVKEIKGLYPSVGAEAINFRKAIRERQQFALRHIREAGISIEVNPTSNECVALEHNENHPLPFFMEEGVRITINTDDAGILGTDINREITSATRMVGLSEAEARAVIEEGFSSSFAVTVKGESLEHLR